MSWKIDQPVRVGTGVFAAIVEMQIDIRPTRHFVVGHGSKRPIMYLFLKGDTFSGIDIHGRTYTKDEIERRYPTAKSQLGAMLQQKQ